ncbi:MAG: glycosyltransferase family 2 protein, partial [Coriobacteriia bacterium]|nr:glycosyltransferase family 2 protein [Coriobacteriia bacterium]
MTAIVLTKNEEKNIANCLNSIKSLVKRIVIVDSGSTDKTVEVAKSFGADVYYHEWVHYASQFNWALDNVGIETTWVFRIDADEIVTPELAQELEKECDQHAEDEVNGMEMPFKLLFLGRYLTYGGVYPIWKITVFKYGTGKFENRSMGEHVVLEKGSCIRLKEDCLHHDFKDLSSWIEKHNAYSTREVEDRLAVVSGRRNADLKGNAAQAEKMRDSLY